VYPLLANRSSCPVPPSGSYPGTNYHGPNRWRHRWRYPPCEPRGGIFEGEALRRVDCPELKQAGGKEARALVPRLAFGRVLLIESKGEDRYKRIIGRVFLLSGNTLSRELVKAGLCWWYRKYAPDDQYLEVLETEAKAEKRGLWANPNPIPPWKWRKERRKR
jgi:micrococcal nuclease